MQQIVGAQIIFVENQQQRLQQELQAYNSLAPAPGPHVCLHTAVFHFVLSPTQSTVPITGLPCDTSHLPLYGICSIPQKTVGLPRWLSGQKFACDAGDAGLIPGLGRSPAGRNGNPLQYSCLENPMGRGAWWAIKRVAEELDVT